MLMFPHKLDRSFVHLSALLEKMSNSFIVGFLQRRRKLIIRKG